jgi:HSP20 family molecular chaperone IbpA
VAQKEVKTMKLAVYDEIGDLERRMDDLMRSFFGPTLRLSRPVLPLFAAKPFVPVTDVFVRDEDLVIRTELPGVDAEDLKVTIEDGYVVIRGERKREQEVTQEAYYRMEASYGTFERFIPLPEGFEEPKIEAVFAEGVLEVIVPAAAKALKPQEPKIIPVKTTGSVKAAKKVA